MECYALSERGNRTKVRIVTTFKDAYETSLAEAIRDLGKLHCEPLIVEFRDHRIFRSV